MAEPMSLGAEPRRRPRPDKRIALTVAGGVVLVATAVALLVAQPWRVAPPARLTATGETCTVGFGSDLVVVAVELTNPSTTDAVTLDGIHVAASASRVTPSGGPIDIVSGRGCEHVLGLRGDEVPPGGAVWVGLTVRSTTCETATAPLEVGFHGHGSAAVTAVDVALAAGTAPVCGSIIR